MELKKIERISKALGDVNRLKILEEVTKRDILPCALMCDLFGLAQSSISHHVKQLVDAELLIPEKEGRNMRYRVDHEVLGAYINYLKQFKE